MSEITPDLVIYGGAFDPPHAGHVACVALVQAVLPTARIKIVPGLKPPVAGGAMKSPVASFADRLAMCRLAFPGVEVDAIEERLPIPNYTFRTIEALAATEPGLRLGWLIGSDQLEAFAGWRNPQRILDLADLIVVSRPGGADSKRLPQGLRGRLRMIGSANSSASSQSIRACLSRGEPVPQGWLPAAIEQYLARQPLYSKKDIHESP